MRLCCFLTICAFFKCMNFRDVLNVSYHTETLMINSFLYLVSNCLRGTEPRMFSSGMLMFEKEPDPEQLFPERTAKLSFHLRELVVLQQAEGARKRCPRAQLPPAMRELSGQNERGKVSVAVCACYPWWRRMGKVRNAAGPASMQEAAACSDGQPSFPIPSPAHSMLLLKLAFHKCILWLKIRKT